MPRSVMVEFGFSSSVSASKYSARREHPLLSFRTRAIVSFLEWLPPDLEACVLLIRLLSQVKFFSHLERKTAFTRQLRRSDCNSGSGLLGCGVGSGQEVGPSPPYSLVPAAFPFGGGLGQVQSRTIVSLSGGHRFAHCASATFSPFSCLC